MIIVSLISAKKKGAFRQLIGNILQSGFDFEIPTPSKRMREIGTKQGWNICLVDAEFGPVVILTNRKADSYV